MRTNQLDLFVATASDVSSKEHQDLMTRCWFSLAKQRRSEAIEHHFGENWVKITADDKYGMATIFDNDILIYIIAQYMAHMNGNFATSTRPGRIFQFTGYEYYNFVGKKRLSGKGYADLWKGMERLHHTFVETNIRLGDLKRHHSFNWLSEIKQTVRNGRHEGYQVVIADWLYESIMNKKMVLTLDDDYFTIKGGLERWLYMFARKTSGHQTGGWAESVESIYLKSGSKSTFTEFKRQLGKIVKKNTLLGYDIEEVTTGRHDDKKALHFLRRSDLIKMVSQGRQRRGAKQWRKDS
jgi:plasmid replication initiation protein